MSAAQFPAVPGPRWTRKRLVDMLIECYGPSPRGAVDVTAVAEYAAVGESTVRRWISANGGANNRRPAIPARRLAQLQLGPVDIENRNTNDYLYALDAINKIAEGRVEASWRDQGWLSEHVVAVIAVAGKPWLQVVSSNQSRSSVADLRRRGTTVESVVVPTRHHAHALARAVMLTMHNWRVHPAAGVLKRGATMVWMGDAPQVDLEGFAQQLFST